MSACRWNGPTRPRILVGRHEDSCDDEACRGCQPCVDSHCVVCATEHDDGACPSCRGEVRDDLHAIVKLHGDALGDALAVGVESNAAMIVAPAANAEAWNHQATSAHIGRIDASYLADCRHELHPLFVLGMHDFDWRDVFDQPSDLLLTVQRAADYLERNLERAGKEHMEFDQFAREVRACRRWLEDVLHDGQRDDKAAAPCFDCGGTLVRPVTPTGRSDGYRCQRCKRTYDVASYWLAVRAHAESEAEKVC